MSIDTIIANLTDRGAFSEESARFLRKASDKKTFLERVIAVYEAKAEDYLDACFAPVKKALGEKGEAKTWEKVIVAAYQAFLETDKKSLLGMLRASLVKQELLPSLGLAIPNDEFVEVAKRVFVSYTARYRLFKVVDRNALLDLCQESRTGEQAPFPLYLLSAFQISKQPLDLYKHVQGLLFYLGQVIEASPVSASLRKSHFYYLKKPKDRMEFIDAIARGLVGVLSQKQKRLEIAKKNSAALLTKVKQICLPALSFLDMKISVDSSKRSEKVERLRQALEDNERAGRVFEQEMRNARQEAMREVDEWRRSIPERPLTFYVEYGIPFR